MQGNIFTGVCLSKGGGHCMMSFPAWLPGPMFLPGGHSLPRGVSVQGGGRHPAQTSGRYAFYWNAFLFIISFSRTVINSNVFWFTIVSEPWEVLGKLNMFQETSPMRSWEKKDITIDIKFVIEGQLSRKEKSGSFSKSTKSFLTKSFLCSVEQFWPLIFFIWPSEFFTNSPQ